MALPMGGHLTHGTKVSFSGKWFNAVHYGVDKDTEDIDYDELERLAKEHQPKVICAGGSAIPRLIDFERIRRVADEVGAIFWVDAAHFIGLVAGKAIPSPVPYADVVCATTHKVLRGPRGGMILCGAELAERVDRAVFPFTQGGAQMHSIAAKAVAFGEAATPAFRLYAHQVVANARALAARLAAEGLVVTTGGTDTHLITADPAPLGVDGRTARGRLAAAGMVLDCCALPHGDTRGLRLGTAAVTTQGMGEEEMGSIASLLADVLRGGTESQKARDQVRELTGRFQPYTG